MGPKPKETTGRKPMQIIARPPISDSSLVRVPQGAIEVLFVVKHIDDVINPHEEVKQWGDVVSSVLDIGYQKRILTGIDWTLLERGARHHRNVCQNKEIPKVTFSEALKNKLDQSILYGFLSDEAKMSLENYRDLILPTILWDQEKFANEEAKICFRKVNCITDNIKTLIKETCKAGNREYMRKALKKVQVLRLNDTNMTDLDESLLNYKNLISLNLCGNYIDQIQTQFIPPTLRTLELHANSIRHLQNIVSELPSEMVYLGLSRNLLNDECAVSLALLPFGLTVLDLSNNDIVQLEPVLTALAKLPNLNSLALVGNPCALSSGYARFTLRTLVRLRWLDYREVLPNDRPLEPFDIHTCDLRSNYFVFTIFRVISAPQPPKTEKGASSYFHIEVELPLLDSQRRNFLMFRRNESLVELLPPPEDPLATFSESVQEQEHRKNSSQPRLSAILDHISEQSSHSSDIYKNPITKNSRILRNYRIFESNHIPWAKIMQFQEPALRIFCPDLTALRDTFRSAITVRLVYTLVTTFKPPPKEKDRRHSHAPVMLPKSPLEQKVVLAEIKCNLKQPDWSQPEQHFHWDESLTSNEAIHWGDGSLAALHYTYAPTKASRIKDLDAAQVKIPNDLTIHCGYEVEYNKS